VIPHPLPLLVDQIRQLRVQVLQVVFPQQHLFFPKADLVLIVVIAMLGELLPQLLHVLDNVELGSLSDFLASLFEFLFHGLLD
jgi:hypothetical protein